MKIRRSLSPRRIFFEQDGVVKKLTIKGLEARRGVRTGWARTGGVMTQWGVSGGGVVEEEIEFPMVFQSPPIIQINIQGGRYATRNVTTTGFTLLCNLDHIQWMAIGPG